ncbi:MAG TPA: VOC family protein [Actinomycetota bacterium]|nr:VOC family protein [Actinomycetota bacterium]
MFSQLDHLVIKVSDLAEAEDDYTALLGRQPSWRGNHPGLGTSNLLYRLSNTYVELLHLPEGVSVPFAPNSEDVEGLVAFALGTDDLEAERQRLVDQGLIVSPVIDGFGREQRGEVERLWRAAFIDPSSTRSVAVFAIQHLSPPDALPLASALPGSDSPVEAVDHIVILSGDADSSIALYRDKFAMDLRLDKTFPDWGMRLAFFRLGGVTVEVAQKLGDEPSDKDAIWGASYRVEDVATARSRLLENGFDVSEVRPGRRPGTEVITVRSKTHGVATLMLSRSPSFRAGGSP